MKPKKNIRTKLSSMDVDQVAEKIRRDIFSGIRLPRERLTESKLTETYSVSRMVIRQVLSLLEKEDLVVIEPFKGASVADVSLKKIAESYQVVSMLEGFSARLATERITQADLSSLRNIVEAQKKLGAGDAKEWMNLNFRFHRTIHLRSGNEKLKAMIRQCARFTSYWFLILSAPGRMPKSNEEHAMILVALSKRDSRSAGKLMENHISEASRYLMDSLKDTLPMGVVREM